MITQENIPYTADEIKAMVKTIEELRKKYNGAVERAKDMLSYKEVRQEDMEYLFPELKESEDERVRKAIIRILKGETGYTSKEDTDKYIAWVEKQGEKKPTENAKTLDADKVIEWLRYHIQVDIAHAKARCMAADEVIERFKKDFGLC